MDDIGSFVAVVVVIVLIVMLVMIGIVAIVGIGVIAGLGYLVYKLVKAIWLHLEKLQREEEGRKLAEAQDKQAKALQAAEEARKAEAERLHAMRQTQEEAARQRLEAERDQTEAVFELWPGRQVIAKPSPSQVDAIIAEGTRVQSHSGRHLLVLAVIGKDGVALQWKAHMAAGSVPKITGLRDHDEMFTEWAFIGRHTARLAPGRYTLSFHVAQPNQLPAGPDVAFEIFVPHEEQATGAHVPFEKAVEDAADEFVREATTVAGAKQKVKEALVASGHDPDEVDLEISRLEVQIKKLRKES